MVSSFPQSLMPPDLCRTIAAIRRVFPEFDPRVQSTNGLRTTQKAVIKLRANQKEPRRMRPFFKTWLTICLLMPLAAHATNREQRLPNVNGYTPKSHVSAPTSKNKQTAKHSTHLATANSKLVPPMANKQSSNVLSRAVNVLGTPYRWG